METTTPTTPSTVPLTPSLDDRQLDETFAALANPTRRAILARLAHGPAGVNELAAPFEMSLPAISKHVKVLERAGLVVRGRHAQFRPCAISPERLRDVASWVDQYRAIWETRFDQLDAYLRQLSSDQTSGDPSTADQTSRDRSTADQEGDTP